MAASSAEKIRLGTDAGIEPESTHQILPPPERELGRAEWIGFVGMIFGVFMAVLDIQIVASSLEQIQAGLSATRDEIGWVQTAYLVAEVVIIPLSGWLGRALSTRYLFVLACGGFTLLSFCCALAWDLPSMVVFRALQGLFGGAMIPSIFAVIYTLFPPRLQPPITILVGLVVTVAPTAGPVLGGYLTETVSWKALFLINLLPGFLVCLAIWRFLRIDDPEWDLLNRIDFRGILYIVVFLGSLQFVLEEGARKDWFESGEIVFFAGLAAVGGVAMFYRELTLDHPIVDLWAFRNRNFAIGCVFSFILGIGLYTMVYLIPVYLAGIKGLNSLQVGEYVMVTGLAQFVSAFVAGPLSKVLDSRLMLAGGLALYGTGAWMNGSLTADAGYWEFFWPQAMEGFALMFCFLAISGLALGTLPTDEVKNASGLFNLMRNLGGAIGIAVSSSLQIRYVKAHYAALRESVTAGSGEAEALIAGLQGQMAGFPLPDSEKAAFKHLYQWVMREAEVMAANDLFHLLGAIFFASLVLMPLVNKVSTDPGASAGH
jgi:DHA2 family multidrug resistance protein